MQSVKRSASGDATLLLMMMRGSMLPKANPKVVYRSLPDGGVLFSPASETYFGLNATGACIWENLAPVRVSVDEICAEVTRRFPGADADQVMDDIGSLLSAFAENGLVVTP